MPSSTRSLKSRLKWQEEEEEERTDKERKREISDNQENEEESGCGMTTNDEWIITAVPEVSVKKKKIYFGPKLIDP